MNATQIKSQFNIDRSNNRDNSTVDMNQRIDNQLNVKKSLFIPPFWAHFLSGGIAGTVSAIITCPLEVVKTRFQSSHYKNTVKGIPFSKYPLKATWFHIKGTLDAVRSVYRNEGLFALWKGIGATVIGVMPSRAIFFSTYQTTKSLLAQDQLGGGALIHLASALTAGITTSTLTNPIWLIKTRMQLQSNTLFFKQGTYYKNSWHCLKTVIEKEGAKALYQGLSASYLGVIEGTIQWMTYEKLKKIASEYHHRERGNQKEKTLREWVDYFMIAATAKVVACCIAYPHEVLRTRLRQGKTSDGVIKYTGLIQATKSIFKEEGIYAFYGGMTAHLMRVVPNAAIMFCCYEFLIHTFQPKS